MTPLSKRGQGPKAQIEVVQQTKTGAGANLLIAVLNVLVALFPATANVPAYRGHAEQWHMPGHVVPAQYRR